MRVSGLGVLREDGLGSRRKRIMILYAALLHLSGMHAHGFGFSDWSEDKSTVLMRISWYSDWLFA